MFSGIIEFLGVVSAVKYEKQDLKIQAMEIKIKTGIPDLILGESVAVNGVCLTVTKLGTNDEASFFISSETLDRTNLYVLIENMKVNLERAVTPSTRLSGHIVQGHVDATGRIFKIEQKGEAHQLFVALPSSLRKYVVEKGSIAIDGVSLTINGIKEIAEENHGMNEFLIDLMIIPHTWNHTRLGLLKVDDIVNIEVDIISKYVENLCRVQK